MRYLKGTIGQGILLQSTNSFQLKAFVDSDWASCLDARHSVTRFCIFQGDSLISWKTKKQARVSSSSAKTEYRALAMVSSEISWIYHVLHDLQLPSLALVVVYCDNEVAIVIASNPTFHERIKQIEIDCHFVR